jgi:hypothetical protein
VFLLAKQGQCHDVNLHTDPTISVTGIGHYGFG